MNHPRRLLLLVPLALLGAALLVRARLPRPQTEGDKWLWEQAESVRSIEVEKGMEGYQEAEHLNLIMGYSQALHITERHGIRALLHSFEKVPAFVRIAVTPQTDPTSSALVVVELNTTTVASGGIYDGSAETLWLLRRDRGFALYRQNVRMLAPVDAHSAQRFLQRVRETSLRSQHATAGYSAYEVAIH